MNAGIIPHTDLIQSYTSIGGTPEYKDSNTDLVYKVQQGDMLTFSITLNPNYTNLECEWTVRRGSAVLTSATGTSFSWTVPLEDSTWEIEVEVVSRDAVGNPIGKDTVSWSITTIDIVTVNPGESIQEAIDSLPSEGGVVELAAGTYYPPVEGTITVTLHTNQKTPYTPTQVEDHHWIGNVTYSYAILLNNRNNITIRGAGRDETVLINEGEEYKMIFIVKGSNNTIKDLSMRANISTGYLKKSDGISIIGKSRDIAISNVKVERFQYGIRSGGYQHLLYDYHAIENLTIRDSMFVKNEYNVVSASTYSGLITDCESYGSVYGFKLDQNSQDFLIERNIAHHNGICGIKIYSGGVKRNTIKDNICYENKYGIMVNQGAQYTDVINNTFRSNTQYGIYIQNKNSATDYVNISNNRIFNNGNHGIEIFAEQPSRPDKNPPYDITIKSNTIYNNGGDGICQDINLYDIVVKNNIIANNSGYGINHLNDESQFILSYNDVWSNALGNYNGTSAGTGDISEDPLFADPDNGDFHLKSQAGRWNGSDWVTDSVTSPCIDAGDPSEKDPDGTRINMGAYGGTSEASKSPSCPKPKSLFTHNAKSCT